jgi:hypothetical protein
LHGTCVYRCFLFRVHATNKLALFTGGHNSARKSRRAVYACAILLTLCGMFYNHRDFTAEISLGKVKARGWTTAADWERKREIHLRLLCLIVS